MKNERITLSREQFDRMKCIFPCNKVIVRIEKKPINTPSGINLDFNDDVLYAEGEDSHVANMSTVMGTIVKQPDRLYFNPHDINSMSWETEIETAVDDVVWSHPLNVRNADEIMVDGVLYQVWNYEDIFCSKREIWVDKWAGTKKTVVVPLNGNVILQPIYKPKLSEFDPNPPELDKERAIVRFNGSNNKRYRAEGVMDIEGLQEGQTVLIDKNTYIIWLERFAFNSNFDNGKMYYALQKRYILCTI